jgi:hypothetical protein
MLDCLATDQLNFALLIGFLDESELIDHYSATTYFRSKDSNDKIWDGDSSGRLFSASGGFNGSNVF